MKDDDGMVMLSGGFADVELLQIKSAAFEMLFQWFYYQDVDWGELSPAVMRYALARALQLGIETAERYLSPTDGTAIICTRGAEWESTFDRVLEDVRGGDLRQAAGIR